MLIRVLLALLPLVSVLALSVCLTLPTTQPLTAVAGATSRIGYAAMSVTGGRAGVCCTRSLDSRCHPL